MTEGTQAPCPSCGNTNPADAQFCRECGAILPAGREAKRAASSDIESWKPSPDEMPLSPPQRRSGRLAAIIAVTLLVLVGLAVYQRHRASSLIPVPGQPEPAATPVAEISPAETPAEGAAAKPTLPPPPAEPTPPREEARVPPAPNFPPERSEEPVGRHHPGWYRVQFRSPLFREPSETAPIVTYLAAGTRIRVTRVLPGFLAVESTTGKEPGYISSDDVLPESVSGTYP